MKFKCLCKHKQFYFLKKFSFHTFSGHHIVYEPDSDQIFTQVSENNNMSNNLNILCSFNLKHDVS